MLKYLAIGALGALLVLVLFMVFVIPQPRSVSERGALNVSEQQENNSQTVIEEEFWKLVSSSPTPQSYGVSRSFTSGKNSGSEADVYYEIEDGVITTLRGTSSYWSSGAYAVDCNVSLGGNDCVIVGGFRTEDANMDVFRERNNVILYDEVRANILSLPESIDNHSMTRLQNGCYLIENAYRTANICFDGEYIKTYSYQLGGMGFSNRGSIGITI